MTREELQLILEDPCATDPEYLADLMELSKQYPYCAPLHGLVLLLLHKMGDLRYSSELHKRVLSMPDLRRLYFLLNQMPTERVTRHARRAVEKSEEERGSFDLIDSFLEEHPEDSSELELLLEIPEQRPLVEPEASTSEIINQFLEQGTEAEKIAPVESESEELPPESPVSKSPVQEDELFTETLARIYIRQGKYERAARILRQVNLEFPKKSGYFAEQLDFLEKLIMNEKK